MDSLTQAYDDSQISEAVFIDFSKAFNRVLHAPPPHKFKAYGFEGKVLTFLENILSKCLFSVEVPAAHSASSPASSGVLQGSVLSPLLFYLIYVNYSASFHINVHRQRANMDCQPPQLQASNNAAKRRSID